ncbi:FAD-dependent oxidase [Paenibacillus selenitireducens]|uniref:FAD-dependent oxidase n=1 Tax=Paenibacillus selenitireducens TaxID=1324314 RepID=A0A1T2WZS5_9BACL|nr:FAD-binding oxidoreductase [Paenibacillus selenitireducens]OPA73075.1 FAD-dependent oxidase [Paenibacillus selenitireducens]
MLRLGKEPELTGRIVESGNSQYNSARREFNTYFNKFPRVVVFAQKNQDVVNAIRWARYNKVPIRMRSGRHSYEGLSVVNGGIVIDVSDMQQVDVNRKRGTATVQAGIRGGALNSALWEEGLVVPVGLCPTTGIAGVTLGGGHSILSRPYGLTLDHLVDIEMVNADGRIIHANATQNKDLFWALRGGGGGNFGVCTNFRFRTHPIETVGFVEIGWDLNDLEAVLRTWQDYTVPGANERLTVTLGITNGRQSTQSKSAKQQSQVGFPILMQGVFLGSVKELRQVLQPILRAGSPRKVVIERIPWIESVRLVAKTTPTKPYPFKSVGPYVFHRLPKSGISTIRRFIESPPTSGVSVFLHGLGGAVAKVPNRATAYYYRRALYNMTPSATWNTQEEANRGIRWVENFRREMLPFTKGVYVNTPDLKIKNWQQAYFGGNFERLTRVKAQYDPKNIFHFPQSIPPARR